MEGRWRGGTHLLGKLARLLLARLPQARSVGHRLLQRILQLFHRRVLLRATPSERLLLREGGLPWERCVGAQVGERGLSAGAGNQSGGGA